MLIQDNLKNKKHLMKETFSSPHNPSESFANSSHEHAEQKKSVLESEAAAHAAKPWMDVAVDLHDAKNAAASDMLDEGQTVYDIEVEGSLESLTRYAEKRARAAANGERGDDLTPDEEMLLDAHKAETKMEQAKTEFNDDTLTDDQIHQAWRMANQRIKAARQMGDKAAEKQWRETARFISDYQNLRSGDVDSSDEYAVKKRINPQAGNNAGYVLDTLSEDGVVKPEYAKFAKAAKEDTANMERMAEVYELFGEAQRLADATQETNKNTNVDVDTTARNERILAEYAQYKDTYDTAEQNLDFDAMLHDGEDGFAKARQKLETQLRHYQAQGAAGDVYVKRLEQMQHSLSDYIADSQRGAFDFPQATLDLKAARGRSEVMKFLAGQYPKQEVSSARQETPPASATEAQAARVEKARREAYAAASGEASAYQKHEQETTHEKVIGEVLRAARDSVRIHTDMPNADVRSGGQQVNLGGKGFGTFGSSAEIGKVQPTIVQGADTPEIVQFKRANKEPVYEEGVYKKRFGKDVPYKHLVGHQDVPLPTVRNGVTGQQEPGVAFRYSFSSQIDRGYGPDLPVYATHGGRPGNLLDVEVILPESVAATLEQSIRDDPTMVRELIHQLVAQEGAVSEAVWNGTHRGKYSDGRDRVVAAMRPPYDKLPKDWKIGLYGDEMMSGTRHETLDV